MTAVVESLSRRNLMGLKKFYTKRRRKIQPVSPIPCRVVDNFDKSSIGFPSRSKAKKFMGKIISKLPPKQSSREPDRLWIENL
jgi:hypothetical protein